MWTPFPAGKRRNSYTTLQRKVQKLKKTSHNPNHSDSCVSHHTVRFVQTHTHTQIQWSFWSFLQIKNYLVYEWKNAAFGSPTNVLITENMGASFYPGKQPSGCGYCCSSLVSTLAGFPQSDWSGVWGLIYFFCPIAREPKLTPLPAWPLFPPLYFIALSDSSRFLHAKGNTDSHGAWTVLLRSVQLTVGQLLNTPLFWWNIHVGTIDCETWYCLLLLTVPSLTISWKTCSCSIHCTVFRPQARIKNLSHSTAHCITVTMRLTEVN